MKRDWVSIRAGYEAGTQSLRDYAVTCGVPFGTLGKRAAAEKWKQNRKQNADKVLELATEALVEQRAELIVAGNKRDLTAADKIMTKALALAPKVRKPADVHALASAIQKAQAIRRLALGQSTDKTEHDFGLDRVTTPEQRLLAAQEFVRSARG